ncbi:MAG: alginate lyase family protein [Balneolales bacterium]
MKVRYLFLITFLILLFTNDAKASEIPRLGGWNYDWMIQVKDKLDTGDQTFQPAYQKLIADAETALKKGVYSVTFKKMVPPSGSKNDYMSMGPYWWPDPEKSDGLPYIRRDGEVNPERDNLDRPQVGGLVNDVRTLTLAWFFSGQSEYAEKAAGLLRVWFLDPETLMNPHLKYGQSIPGRTEGRGIGIIDTRAFHVLVDAISVLETSNKLSGDELEDIRTWFGDYFTWLTESQFGKDEEEHPNNHSVAFDAQASGIAYFIGNDEYVARKAREIPQRRIDPMIESDGRQPAELSRTRAHSYSVSNLRNFFDAGEIGLKAGVDIFNYENPDEGSLPKALDYLIDYIDREEDWPYEQISDWTQSENNLGLLIHRAAGIYDNEEYKTLWEELFFERVKTHWSLLVTQGM